MIGYIKGIVKSINADTLLIDYNGLGFRVFYPHTDKVRRDDEITVFTYMAVREDDISLFGFESEPEYNFFLKLIGVKGLGPKTALNILAFAEYGSVIRAIEDGDITFIKRLPGIGAKTASQIILDLKGKLVEATSEKKEDLSKFDDVISALKSLGYKAAEINPVVKEIAKEKYSSNEEYLRAALKLINSKR